MQQSPRSDITPNLSLQNSQEMPSPRRNLKFSMTPDINSFESKVARLREELQYSNKVNRNILEGMYDEILHTFSSLHSLNEEKLKLKEALQDVIHKKDELYKEALIYYNTWKKEAEKTSFLQNRLQNAEKAMQKLEQTHSEMHKKLAESEMKNSEYIKRYAEMHKTAKEYVKDRESISMLVQENERLKEELDTMKNRRDSLDTFKPASPLMGKISKLSEFILMKVKEYSELNELFRNKVCRGSEFRNFVMKQNWEEAVYKLLQFISELITYQPDASTPINSMMQTSHTQTSSERYSDSPVLNKYRTDNFDKTINTSFETRVSPSSSLRTGLNSMFRSDDKCNRLLYYSDNLLDSIHSHNDRLLRLNQQIHDTMASSKKLLGSSPSKSMSQSGSRLEFRSVESHETPQKILDKKLDSAERKLEPSEVLEENLIEDARNSGIRVRDAKSPSKIPNISTVSMPTSPRATDLSKSESENAFKQNLNTSVHINRIKKRTAPKIDTKQPREKFQLDNYSSPRSTKDDKLSHSTSFTKKLSNSHRALKESSICSIMEMDELRSS